MATPLPPLPLFGFDEPSPAASPAPAPPPPLPPPLPPSHAHAHAPVLAELLARNSADVAWATIPDTAVLHPTPDEFADAMAYIRSISELGMRYGIVRIVPPTGWAPGFHFDPSVVFGTRRQAINMLQTRTGASALFAERLENFLLARGLAVDVLAPELCGRSVDLRLLFQAVSLLGGYEAVTRLVCWGEVALALCFARDAAPALQQWYRVLLLEYELAERDSAGATEQCEPVGASASAAGSDATRLAGASKIPLPLTFLKPSPSAAAAPAAPAALVSRADAPAGGAGVGASPLKRKRGVDGIGVAGSASAGDDEHAAKRARPLSTAPDKSGDVQPTQGQQPAMVLQASSQPAATPFAKLPDWEALRTADRGDYAVPVDLRRSVESELGGFAFSVGGEYTLAAFRRKSQRWTESLLGTWALNTAPAEHVRRLEAIYWNLVETGSELVEAEYGADLDVRVHGSGFAAPDRPAGASDWSLLRLPLLPDSLLSRLPEPILGVTVPWFYAGHTFSSFCWHTEDNYMPSINYVHLGAPKIWYGIPPHAARDFERVWSSALGSQASRTMYHLTSMLSPAMLQRAGVPVYRATQRAGEFIVTWPQAYHAGFNAGFNCAEAANFALDDWPAKGLEAGRDYRPLGRPPTFSVEGLFIRLALAPGLTPRAAAALLPVWQGVAAAERAERAAVERAGVCISYEPGLGNLLHGVEMRAAAAAAGAGCAEVGLTSPQAFIDASDADYSCGSCRCYCPLSIVRCMCKPAELRCLEHYASLCDCPLGRKEVCALYSLADLDEIESRLRARAAQGGAE